MPNWRQSSKKYKGRVVFRGDIVKDDSGSMQYSMSKDYQHHKCQQQKSWVSSPDCLVVMDKQQTQYQRIPKKNGRCSQIVEISKSECPHIWIRVPRHKWPKSWSSMEDPVVPLERNLYDQPLDRTVMGKAM